MAMLLLLIFNLAATIFGVSLQVAEFQDEVYFNHKYLADSAYVYEGNTLVRNDQRVGVIPDLIGDAPMQYSGNMGQSLADSYPKYFKPLTHKEGYIFFDNVFNEKLSSPSSFSQPITGKRELWLVMRRPGIVGRSDAYLKAWKSGFFSDKGEGKVGLSEDGSEVSSNTSVSIPLYEKTLVRIKLDGDLSEIFINNVRVQGPRSGGYFSEGSNNEWQYFVIGSDANNAYWDWYASYYKEGNFSGQQAQEVYTALAARHETRLVSDTEQADNSDTEQSDKSLPASPFATNVKIVKNGDIYAVDYTFNNPLGFAEDTLKTEYQFIYSGRGNGPSPQESSYIGKLNNRKSFNRKDFAVGNTLGNPELFSFMGPYAWFRMTVKVYDTEGNSWRFQSADWRVDSDYPFAALPDALFFDHKYLADSAYVYSTTNAAAPVTNNERAGLIPDLLGNAPMQYAGDGKWPLKDSYPKYFRDTPNKEGYVFIDNVFDEKFHTISKLEVPMTGKRELWLVMRRPGLAANTEAYLNDHNAGYFSDRGQGKSGLSNADSLAISPTADVKIPFNAKTLVRIKLDGLKSEIFINNVRVQGPLAGGYFSEGNNGMWQDLVIGATTNNAYWDWYASYYKRGNFSVHEAADVYHALAKRHDIGATPDAPYASDIRIVRHGDIYSVAYNFNSPKGLPEDKTKTEYQLIYGERGDGPNIQNAYYIDVPSSKLRSLNRKDFALGNTLGNPELFSPIKNYGWFRMTVKVYDTEGNSWRYQTTEWRIDNEYDVQGSWDALFFDHKYLADSAYVYSTTNTTTPVKNNERAGVIPDLLGNAPMQYAGDGKWPLKDSYPKYFRDTPGKEGYVFIDNVFDEKFHTISKLEVPMTGKRELWLVMRRPGLAANTEAYLNDYNAGYFSDRGQGKSGLSNSDSLAISPTADVKIPFNAKTLVRIKLDGLKSEIFINNVRVQGPLAGGYFSEGNNGKWQDLVIGATTNNAYWDWYASYYKRGNLSALQAADVYKELARRHDIGATPDAPYASDIRIVRNGDIYSVAYNFISPKGLPEDKTKTEYQLIYGDRGSGPNIQNAYYIDVPSSKLRSLNRKDFALGNTLGNPELFSPLGPYGWFRMTVKVYDSEGNSWRFQTAQWRIDNEYNIQGFPDAQYFDHKYVADNALAYNATAAVSDDQRVGVIPDLVGKAPMHYAGDNVTSLSGSHPKYFKPFKGKEGYIFFDNVTNEKYSTISKLDMAMTGKRELWLVMRRPGKAGNYDAYLNALKSGYFSGAGEERIGLASEGSNVISPDGKVSIPFNVKTLVRIKLDGDKSEIFINNQRVPGPGPGGYFSEGSNGEWENLVIGSDANNAYWDWYASYYKQGTFSVLQAADIYNALAKRHDIGSAPAAPYASDIRISKNGDTFALTYNFISPKGLPEDKSKTEYQFIYGGRSNSLAVESANYIPALANKSSFNRKDFAVGNTLGNPGLFSFMGPYAWFRMTVKVYDTEGNSWRFQSANWTVDSDYPFAALPEAQYFDHKYLADSAYVYSTTNTAAPVTNNERAGLIPDLLGNAPMQYAGDGKWPLKDSYPKYFRDTPNKEGYVFIDNVFDEKFHTISKLEVPMTGKRELWLVMRRPGLAANTEAYLNDHNAGYFSDRGQGKSGLSNSDSLAISPTADVKIPFNAKTLVRIKLDGLKSEIFINNVRVQGPLAGGYFSEGNNGMWQDLVIGATTNNAYWDWFASYYKRGNFSVHEAADVYHALADRHDIGATPDAPYATDIRIVRHGDIYSVAYNFNSPKGLPEDKTKTEYQLIYGDRGDGPNIQNAYYIDVPSSKLRSLNRKDFALGNTLGNPELFSPIKNYGWFRMTVKVYDTEGNSWRFQTTEWRIDNEYDVQGFPDAQYFDHKYLAGNAYVYSTTNTATPVKNNERAGLIPDLVGNAPMQYAGDNVTSLTDSHPMYFKPVGDNEGYIFFDNVTNEKFSTISKLEVPMTGKRELWLVMRRSGLAANQDPYLNGQNAGYFSERGQGKVGLASAGSDALSLNGDVSIPFHVKTLVRIKLDGTNSELFINNVRVPGPLAGGYFNEGSNSQWENLVLGSEASSASWDWYGSYYKQGNFSALQVPDVYNALAKRHDIGSLPAAPFASNIRIIKNGDTYALDYTFNNPLGYPEDKSRTEYQFIYGNQGSSPNIQKSRYMSAMDNLKAFDRKEYAVGNFLGNPGLFAAFNPFAWFRMTVKVYDTMGNSWRFQSSPWTWDNDYPMETLPVTLTRFEAKEQTGAAHLLWVTASEDNNLGFEVQGSENGMAFVNLGFVPSHDINSVQTHTYNFLDRSFSSRRDPVYYYRLKQVDLDGVSHFSKMVALNTLRGKASVTPTPFQKEISVRMESFMKGETEVILLDMTGKVVHQQTFQVNKGTNSLIVQPNPALASGVYFIQFENQGKLVRIRTMKD